MTALVGAVPSLENIRMTDDLDFGRRGLVEDRLARMVLASTLTPIRPRPRLPKISLEPASPAVPATEQNKHYQDDVEKCRGVYVASCACGSEREPGAESTRSRIDQFLFSRRRLSTGSQVRRCIIFSTSAFPLLPHQP